MDWNNFTLCVFTVCLYISLAKGDNFTAGPGLRCKQCSHIARPETCTTEVVCYDDQFCSTEEYISPNGNVLYDMDCKQASVCAAGGYTVTITSKSNTDPQVKGKRQTGLAAHACLQCCDSDLCNTNLCGGTVVTPPKLECLACSNVDNPEDCTNRVECQTGEICATERHVTSDGHTYYEMGCKTETICEANGYTGSHVNGSRKRQNSAAECFECCDSELCNGNLCEKKAVTEGRVHCLECTQVAKPEDCLNEVMCYPDESCFTEYFITSQGHAFYDLGCKAKSVCTAGGYNVAKLNVPLVGRKRENELAAHVCEECCDSVLCNRHLCGGIVKDKLLCAKCTEAANATFCQELEQCADNEICFIQQKITDTFSLHYDAGCMHATRCRDVVAQTQTGPHMCFECCNTSYCNTQCHTVTALPTTSTSATSETTVHISTQETTTSTKATTTPVKQTHTSQPLSNAVTTKPTSTKATTTKEIPTTTLTTSHVHTYRQTTSSTTKATTHQVHTQSTKAQATTTVPPCPTFPSVPSVTLNHDGYALHNIGCNGRDKITFLIDHSSMVSKYDEHEFISFVKAFANTLDLGPNATHLGVAIYNNVYLQTFSINHPLDIKFINNKLTNLYHTVQTKGTADLASAIEHAVKDIVPRRNRGKSHLIVLSRADINNINTVVQEAKKAHSEKIEIDFIGIGNFNRYGNSISSIVDKQRGAIFLDTVNQLHELAENLILRRCRHQSHLDALHIPCGGPDILKTLGCRGATDVSFIVDTSDSLTDEDVKRVGQFLYNLVDHMNIAPHATRVGLLTFNNLVRQLVNITTFHSKQTLLNIISHRLMDSTTEGETNTNLALDFARHSFDKSHKDARKYAVLFTDGGSINKMKTIASALELQRHNVTVIVVGIGTDVDVKEELIIASDPDIEHLLNLKSAVDLEKYWKYLNAVRCKDGVH